MIRAFIWSNEFIQEHTFQQPSLQLDTFFLVFIYFITYMHNVLGDDAINDDYMNYLANGLFNSEQMKAPISSTTITTFKWFANYWRRVQRQLAKQRTCELEEGGR
jgi:hypothetical protein